MGRWKLILFPMDLRTYIEKDLFNELRWLLCAATEWEADKRKGDSGVNHLGVYCMDSTFLHARSLYEFFSATKTGGNKVTWKNYGLLRRLTSPVYRIWIDPLHTYVMHLKKGRSGTSNVQGGKHLKNQVVVIAQDILGLWDTFSAKPEVARFSNLLAKKRKEAIQDAALTASRRQITQVFS